MDPITKEISLEFCAACGSTIHESLCTYDCIQDGTYMEDRPPGSVKVAVYVLKEVR